ncbi:hypothetical protein J3F83DRAFT_744197 [Trichoderma novae-zelandiae]
MSPLGHCIFLSCLTKLAALIRLQLSRLFHVRSITRANRLQWICMCKVPVPVPVRAPAPVDTKTRRTYGTKAVPLAGPCGRRMGIRIDLQEEADGERESWTSEGRGWEKGWTGEVVKRG